MPPHNSSLVDTFRAHSYAMEGVTTFLATNTHFPIASKDTYIHSHSAPAPSTRKRKPIVTYQSPGSGVVDVGLLVRNTALEFEAAAAAAATRSASASVPVPKPAPVTPPAAIEVDIPASDTTITPESTPPVVRTLAVHRPVTIPRPPRPLYHPLSRPSTSKPGMKSSTSSTSVTSHLAPPALETGRRSSSRTRRPAPKVRDTEGLLSITKAVQEKPSPVKRRRGAGAGKRKRGPALQDIDADGTYPAAKRTRKPREKVEVEVDGETMPPPTTGGTSPPNGYSTRAKRPRKATHTRAESSTSDGTGSVARTTPVNGNVEEFWVPTKAT